MTPPPFTLEVRRGGEVRKISYLGINLPVQNNSVMVNIALRKMVRSESVVRDLRVD
jgi:hypothetical protein